MDRQQQYIQLAGPSHAEATPPEMQPATEHDDAARLVGNMCPSLYLAVYKGRMEEVMTLLLQQHVAAIDCQATGIVMHSQCNILEVTAERNTVLHVAAEQGHDELIRELYIRFKDQGLLSSRNSALDTPLHCAARAGHVGAIAVLAQLAMNCGENVLGCKNEAGDTALHLAARHGHGAAVEALVSAAAEPATELNNTGVSPLYLAVISGSVQAVTAITTCKEASSAGPSAQNALHAAVFQGSEMVDVLLEWRPGLADQVDSSGSSPLHFASSVGNRTIVRAILRAGPPRTVYRKDSGGQSALHVAARMDHHRLVEDMIASFPDAAELRDDSGGTFLHAAAREKRSSPVSLAIKNPMLRGLLDAQDRDGNTALHLAVAAGAPRVVEALLRDGKARSDVLNGDGRTAFDLAAGSTSFFAMVSMVVTLVAYGAPLLPQRQDHLQPWSGRDAVAQGMEKASDGLAVVAVLIATAALAAGFNVPGGYSDSTGVANLAGNPAFKVFLFLDTFAAAMSVVAVILLVYGKVHRSGGSWKTFAAALHCIWLSLVSLMLAFYAVLVAVVPSSSGFYLSGWCWRLTYACLYGLNLCITYWISPDTTARTLWRFLLRRVYSKAARHHGMDVMVKRQYPLAGPSVLNYTLFAVISFVTFSTFASIQRYIGDSAMGTSSLAAPSPV